MKEQYVADINDYRKYALLRALAINGELKLGVCWMKTPRDKRSDGRKIGYLSQDKRWRARAPELFDLLKRIVNVSDGSRLRCIEEGDAIPGAVFHNEELRDAAEPRLQYMESAWRRFVGTDIVFFDPDNGIEVPSKSKGAKGSSKYIYWDEIREAYQGGHSILVYQHFPYEQRDRFIDRRCKEIRDRFSPSAVWVIRTSHVVFFLLAHETHVEKIVRALHGRPTQPDAGWLSISRYI